MGIFSRDGKANDRLTQLENKMTELVNQRELPIQTLNERITQLERTLNAITEEIDVRIERGNKIWRQIRARERREEKRAEEQGEFDEDQQVFDFDGAGGQPEGMQGMSPFVAAPESSLQPHEEAAKALAAAVARKGLM